MKASIRRGARTSVLKPTLRRQLQLLPVEHAQDLREIMATFEDRPTHRDNHISALLACELRALFNPVERHLRRAAKDAEDRRVLKAVDSVVAPVTSGDELAVNAQDAGEFGTAESNGFGPSPGWRRNVLDSHVQSIACACPMSKAKIRLFGPNARLLRGKSFLK